MLNFAFRRTELSITVLNSALVFNVMLYLLVNVSSINAVIRVRCLLRLLSVSVTCPSRRTAHYNYFFQRCMISASSSCHWNFLLTRSYYSTFVNVWFHLEVMRGESSGDNTVNIFYTLNPGWMRFFVSKDWKNSIWMLSVGFIYV